MLSFIERGSGFPCPPHPIVAVGFWYPMLSCDGTSLFKNKPSWSICLDFLWCRWQELVRFAR
jgi:hypothetical protein